jgi:peptidoglycan/xylan/chitin deacetylase (PgdA/CDA1 family)
VIVHPSLRRGIAALALATLVIPAMAPLTGTPSWTPPARAAEPAVIPPAPEVIWHGSRTDRVVALTFDDGWSPRILRRIYRILVRERVPATFFVTGIYVQRAPALWRTIAAAGFPLANHSYLHRDTRDLTPRVAAVDLALTREVVERATGRPMLPYYRPPYGARNPATDRRAAAAGFPYVVLWDTTASDTTRHATVAEVVRGASAGRPGSIVLLHAGPGVTPRALPAIIASYRARGFRFVTIPELLGASPGGAAPAVSPEARSRSVDRPGGEAGRGQGIGSTPAGWAPPDSRPTRSPTAASGAGGHAVAPVGVGSPPPVRPAASPVAARPVASPPAREAAWARRDGTPATIGVFTVALLGILLAGAALAGRRRGPEGDDTV